MKTLARTIIVLALLLTQNAEAIRLVGEQSEAAATSSQTTSYEREGRIERIDTVSRHMVIGGMSYIISANTASVHGASLLSLKKNDRIRFKVLNESGTERIIEIWLISAAQH